VEYVPHKFAIIADMYLNNAEVFERNSRLLICTMILLHMIKHQFTS